MSSAWREDMVTRAQELDDLAASVVKNAESLRTIKEQLATVREAVQEKPKRRRTRIWRSVTGSAFERALGHIDAAEVHLLRLAPEVVVPALPSIQAHVNRYLAKDDPRRQAVDRIARIHTERVLRGQESQSGREQRDAQTTERSTPLLPEELDMLVSAQHAANSQRRRDLNRLRNFRNLLALGGLVLLLFGIVLGVIGSISPTAIPLCFFPEDGGVVKIACPGGEMVLGQASTEDLSDHDAAIAKTVHGGDVWLVMLLGLLGAALTAAAALRSLGSNSTPFQVPATLVAFKLPTGAVTAVIGLLLMTADFVPGLSALDTPVQILGWAVVFGIAQQLVTQIADSQAAGLLQNVKGRGAAGDRDPGAQPTT